MSEPILSPEQYEQALFDAGLVRESFSYQGATRDVYRGGEGPPVIVLSELPGITPPTVALFERLMHSGYSVVAPQLFGTPGAPPHIAALARKAFAQVCVSREFTMFAERKESPIADWLRALARSEHRRHGGRGVGVIGMCFTGGFALAMMVDDSVMAPVISQPSLPLAIPPRRGKELGLAPEALERIRQRCESEDLCVLGLRFSADQMSPGSRFRRLELELGDRFIGVEIDSSLGNPHGIKPWAHSVLTLEYKDEPGHPTRAAFERVLALFDRQLTARPQPGTGTGTPSIRKAGTGVDC
jgi:dienelactone hydrolase